MIVIWLFKVGEYNFMYDNFPFAFEVIKISDKSVEKIRINSSDIVSALFLLKNNAEFNFDRLNTIIAIDLDDSIELIYDLNSTISNLNLRISTLIDKKLLFANSIVSVYKSAHFDECEIYDLFGIEFVGNKNLKRLLMPQGWI